MNFLFPINCLLSAGWHARDPETSRRNGGVGVTKWNNTRVHVQRSLHWEPHRTRGSAAAVYFLFCCSYTIPITPWISYDIYSIADIAATRTRLVKWMKEDTNDLCFRFAVETLMFVRNRRKHSTRIVKLRLMRCDEIVCHKVNLLMSPRHRRVCWFVIVKQHHSQHNKTEAQNEQLKKHDPNITKTAPTKKNLLHWLRPSREREKFRPFFSLFICIFSISIRYYCFYCIAGFGNIFNFHAAAIRQAYLDVFMIAGTISCFPYAICNNNK